MSLTESRLTRTSTSTGSGTGATTRTVAPLRRGRALVRTVVWTTQASRAFGAGVAGAPPGGGPPPPPRPCGPRTGSSMYCAISRNDSFS